MSNGEQGTSGLDWTGIIIAVLLIIGAWASGEVASLLLTGQSLWSLCP
jgi:hypothetical protein